MFTKPEIIGKVRSEGRNLLTEVESKELLKQAGIGMVDTRLATSSEEAVSLSRELGFPLVLKIVSPDVVHKSDAGGVKLNLKTVAEVGKAYADIMTSVKQHYPQAKIHGVSVQKMARPGIEVIIGMSKDPQFGAVLMFGLGGVTVEIMKDVSLRVVPLNRRDAREMVQEIKGYRLLTGYRGQPPADIKTLEEWLINLSKFVAENTEIKEVDLNPVFAYSDGALAVDARVILENPV
ncbi:MAG: acetate--CoA ligase family protein [Chloroflexota bacterium]